MNRTVKVENTSGQPQKISAGGGTYVFGTKKEAFTQEKVPQMAEFFDAELKKTVQRPTGLLEKVFVARPKKHGEKPHILAIPEAAAAYVCRKSWAKPLQVLSLELDDVIAEKEKKLAKLKEQMTRIEGFSKMEAKLAAMEERLAERDAELEALTNPSPDVN